MKSCHGILFGLFLSLSLPALGDETVRCTTQSVDQWLAESDIRARAASLGYTIDIFKRTTGGCYEIYGRKDGKRAEVYFHPLTGSVVKASR